MFLSFVVSFSTLFFVLKFPLEPLFWLLFLLGHSAALCPNSPQYPQHALKAFLGFSCWNGL